MNVRKDAGGAEGPATSTKPSGPLGPKKESKHPYPISIENLIVHKYSNQEALLHKADKVAQQIIHDELREGEYLQVHQPGRYSLHFPNLRADARELRGSVITEQLYRAIRDLNPAAQQLNNADERSAPQSTAKASPKISPKVSSAPVHASRPSAPNVDSTRDAEMKKMSSAAMAAMAGPGALSQEELLQSPLGLQLSTEISLGLSPIWYAAKRVIIGQDCIPSHNGASLRNAGALFRDSGLDPIGIRAIIDTVTYGQVVTLLRKNIMAKTIGLVMCPVHASTLGHPKYVSAFIAAGSELPVEARNYLIFVVRNFPMPISRIKVRDVASYLKPRSRGLLVDLPLNAVEVSPFFKEFGFHGARTTLSDYAEPEADLLKYLDAFAEKCEKAKLLSTIDGLETRSQTVAARAAGFSYLSGSAIRTENGAELQDFDVDSLFT